MGGSQILRAFLVNDQGRPSLNLAGIDKRRRSPRDAPAWYTRNEVLVEGDSQGHTPGGINRAYHDPGSSGCDALGVYRGRTRNEVVGEGRPWGMHRRAPTGVPRMKF